MLIETVMSERWLSNTYLLGERSSGYAVLIDAGEPAEPITQAITTQRLTPTYVLCTHHHVDHIMNLELFRDRYALTACAHRDEAELIPGVSRTIADGEEIECGDLRIRVLHTPGHTRGMLAFLVNDEMVFTGDTLFRDSVGGTVAPGHATFEDLRHSIMEVLMRLPHETLVYPGHTAATTIGREWEENPFIRLWRGLDAPAGTPCLAMGRAAELIVRATDYDGGTKCWVKYEDGGQDAVVPGSQVEDA
jgi:glyoxylase-like metal-dependent hydrolase (beta-lactamase superfamily II)